MGTTLACVQVFLGDRDTDSAPEEIIQALRERILSGPFEETPGDQDPDRIVYSGRLQTEPWITVFDSLTDMRQLARDLSERLAGTVVFINLIDSDVIHLRLYDRGEMVDDFCNRPELYDSYSDDPNWLADWETLTPDLKARLRGNPQLWHDLFVVEGAAESLREAWDSSPIFADDILKTTAQAFGMNSDAVWEVFDGAETEGFQQLTFRSTEPRLYEIKASGPPRLSWAGGSNIWRVNMGDQPQLFFTVQNDGGESQGLEIMISGSALDKGLIRPVNLVLGRYRDDPARLEAVFSRKPVGDGGAVVFYAALPEAVLPAGIQDAWAALSQPTINWYKAYNALSQTRQSIWLSFNTLMPGEGTLDIEIIPVANPEQGKMHYPQTLTVLPPPVPPPST